MTRILKEEKCDLLFVYPPLGIQINLNQEKAIVLVRKPNNIDFNYYGPHTHLFRQTCY